MTSSRKRVGASDGRHAPKCAICKVRGHNALMCPHRIKGETRRTYAEMVAEAKRLKKVEEAALATDVLLSKEDEDENSGWGVVSKGGRQRCLVCKGEGIDRRQGGSNCCLNCDGEGCRRIAN